VNQHMRLEERGEEDKEDSFEKMEFEEEDEYKRQELSVEDYSPFARP